MKINGYYQNWQIFWGSETSPAVGPLTPNTWTSIVPGLDRISYGFALFGEYPTCTGTPCVPGYQVESPQCYNAYEMYPESVFPWMKNIDGDETVFGQLQALQKANPNLQTLLAFGGWSFNDPGTPTISFFGNMMANQSCRQSFMDSAVTLAQKWGFNGIEIDWEYPGYPGRGGSACDFYNFELFVQEFKATYPKMLLAMDCGPYLSPAIIQANYGDLPGYTDAGINITMASDADYFQWLARLSAAGLDTLQVMAYDYYTSSPSGGVTMPNAPLTTGNASKSKCTSCKAKRKKLTTTYPITTVTVYGQPQTPVSNLLYTYNFLDASGNPDYPTFYALNNLPLPANPSAAYLVAGQKYSICGVSYTVEPGDSYWAICNNFGLSEGITGGPNPLGVTCGGNPPNIASYIQNYNNGLALQPGQVLALPIPQPQAAALYQAGKAPSSACSGGPTPPTPPSITYSVENTITGLVTAYEAAGLDPSQYIWCGIPFYGHSYAGVTFPSSAQATNMGLSYTSAAPGGFFSGNCGLVNAGSITYREIAFLQTQGGPSCTPIGGTSGAFSWPQLSTGVDAATNSAVAYNTANGLWVSYENSATLATKLAWLQTQPLAGVMLFGPADDDANFTLTNQTITTLKSGRKKRTQKKALKKNRVKPLPRGKNSTACSDDTTSCC